MAELVALETPKGVASISAPALPWPKSFFHPSTTAPTASPNRPEGEERASRRRPVTVFDIRTWSTKRCLSAATRAAKDRMGGLLGCTERQISGFLRSSLMSSALTPSPSSSSLSRSAWYACSTVMVCRHEPAWPALRTPCPPVLKMCAAVWRAKWEPSETTQRQGTDSSRASVPPEASLCNTALSPYHSNRTRGRRGRLKKGFAHDLSTSVWRSWKNGRLRCGGGVLNPRKRLSSLPFCGSTWHSASQLMFNLATARVSTSTSSSYWGEWEGTSSTDSTSISSEEDIRSAEPAARGEESTVRASNLGEQL